MKTLHTPGPYGIKKEINKPFRIVCNNRAASKYWIAEMINEGGSVDSKKEEATATLLAAAPTLLKACRVAIDFLTAGESENEDVLEQLQKAVAIAIKC